MTSQQTEYLKLGAGVLVGGLIIYSIMGKPNQPAVYDPTVGGGGTGTSPVVFNAKSVTETLYDAMKEMGTDENLILEILKPISPAQFAAVASKFGNRPYNSLTGNIYNFSPFYDLPLLSLKAWLKYELSTSDYVILRNKYPNSL